MSKDLWKYRRQITVENLGNSFQQQVLSGGEQQNKVLNAFLKQVPPTLRHFTFARMCLFCLQEETSGRVSCTLLLLFWAFANGYDQKICSSNLSIWNDVKAGYSCPRSFCLWVRKKRFSFLQDICKYRLLFNNYRNTSCVSSSFFLTLFVSSVCWWTDFTEELIEKMPRAILSGNFSRIFHEVHATVINLWYITKAAPSSKASLLKDGIYHWHLSGAKWTIKTLPFKERLESIHLVDWTYSYALWHQNTKLLK